MFFMLFKIHLKSSQCIDANEASNVSDLCLGAIYFESKPDTKEIEHDIYLIDEIKFM